MSDLKTKDEEMVAFVEKRNTLAVGNTLLQQTKKLNFNGVDTEFKELNTALESAKDKMNMVPNPSSGIGKWFMKKAPKLSIWFMEKVQGKEFANAESMEKLEILLEQYDQTFIRLYQNIEPTKELQASIIERIEGFKDEKNRINDFLYDNPNTPSKDFLKVHVTKLEGTISALETMALKWLQNNIASRMQMFATAMGERKQLEITLVAGISTLKAAKELEQAAETQTAMRGLTNQIQQAAAEADTRTSVMVADLTTSGIFTKATFEKIMAENEKAQQLVADTKRLNAQENEDLKKMLDNYDPAENMALDNEGAELLNESVEAKYTK